MIANVMKFYEGAITYDNLMQMPFNEIVTWNKYAQKINREIEKSVKK